LHQHQENTRALYSQTTTATLYATIKIQCEGNINNFTSIHEEDISMHEYTCEHNANNKPDFAVVTKHEITGVKHNASEISGVMNRAENKDVEATEEQSPKTTSWKKIMTRTKQKNT